MGSGSLGSHKSGSVSYRKEDKLVVPEREARIVLTVTLSEEVERKSETLSRGISKSEGTGQERKDKTEWK